MILWCRYFIGAQGYTVEHKILYQENKSIILLANIGQMSNSKVMNHIKVSCYLVKDKINKNELGVKCRLTEVIWCDVLNKTIQGTSFRVFHSALNIVS